MTYCNSPNFHFKPSLMPQTIEELQNAPYGEIVNALADLAPQVLDAHDRFKALVAQQRALIAARRLRESDLRLGDKVRLHGHRMDFGLVVAPDPYGLMFQPLKKNGDPYGDPQPEIMLEGFEKI